MGTSAGPNLVGIGRGGDSNLVLEMDAHDAKSYPGEPTTNTLINGYFPGTDTTTVPTGWALHYSASKIGFRPAGEDFFYKNLGLSNPRVYKCNGGGWYSDTGTGFIGIVMPQPTPGFSTGTATTVSFWYRFTGENAAQLSNQTIFFDFDYGLANLTKINYTDYNDTEWHFYSETLTSSGSYAYYNLYIYAGSLYSVCPGGSYFEIGAVQVEQKGYATPFVGDGQFARPASVNLMIHGDVGTGQNIYDSSPSKHTIAVGGNTTHSAAQSKFSGGSIYFDGTGDSLTATSTDFAVGSGEFTIDAWLYKTASTDYETLFDTYSAAGSNGFLCGLWTNSTISFYSENGIGWVAASGSTQVALNTWTHLAWVRSGNNLRMFVDGVQQTNVTFGADNLDSSSLIIGGRSTAQYITGYMDEMRITKGTALWTSNFTPPTRRNLSAPVVDRSSHDNGGNFATTDMTDVATYRVGEVIRPIGSAVWDFDGTDDWIAVGDNSSLDFGTGDFSISFWLYLESNTDAGVRWLLEKGQNDLQIYQVEVGDARGDNKIQLVVGDGTDYASPITSVAVANQWANIAMTFSGITAKIYLNGTLQDTQTMSNGVAQDLSNSEVLEIGRRSGGNYIEGKVAIINMYKNKALTPQQVKENFTQQRSRFNI
jgi:hypothetical protein